MTSLDERLAALTAGGGLGTRQGRVQSELDALWEIDSVSRSLGPRGGLAQSFGSTAPSSPESLSKLRELETQLRKR